MVILRIIKFRPLHWFVCPLSVGEIYRQRNLTARNDVIFMCVALLCSNYSASSCCRRMCFCIVSIVIIILLRICIPIMDMDCTPRTTIFSACLQVSDYTQTHTNILHVAIAMISCCASALYLFGSCLAAQWTVLNDYWLLMILLYYKRHDTAASAHAKR